MSRRLVSVILLAFLLRLGLGLFAHFGLPQAGYGSETERAGYLFFDAYNRDSQARELARSSLPPPAGRSMRNSPPTSMAGCCG